MVSPRADWRLANWQAASALTCIVILAAKISSRNFQEAESGIGAGRHLEKRETGPKEFRKVV